MNKAEETLLSTLPEFSVKHIESESFLKDWIIDAMKKYANYKLDEALLLSYEVHDDDPLKVVDIMDIINLRDKS